MIDIKVDGVSKLYKVAIPRCRRQSFWSRQSRRAEEVWALKKVSFEVLRGEALGIVGHNGAGKSTLIKLLSGITIPTEGEITLKGRVSALIELSIGFDFELSGRDNILLCGSILGMRRREIVWKMAEIIEFAQIGDYIDAPVKTYSSGMIVRLGFSIAAHLEHDILLLDEVLAVGDAAFQARCLDRIDRLRRDGKTIVLISHDLSAIERVCDRAMLLKHGHLMMSGGVREVAAEYYRVACSGIAREFTPTAALAELAAVHFSGPQGGPVRTGELMEAELSFILAEPLGGAIIAVSFYWPSGYLCTQLTSAKSDGVALHAGQNTVQFVCPMLAMQRGFYRVDVSIERNGYVLAHWPAYCVLRVEEGKVVLGDFYLQHHCRMISAEGVQSELVKTGEADGVTHDC